MINSDELGEKGESRFKELCADAGLICNKSDRDRAGWDFIVDFDFDDKHSVSLDHRKTPLSCHVQLKTILSTSKSVRMKLNMAERLAKELKPSFVCVFKVNPDLTFTDAYLIHISSDRLGSILKRLREKEAKFDRKPLNKFFVSFTPAEEERIDITGNSLRESLKRFCGSDIHLYSKEKQTQLQRLGYEGNNFEGKFTLKLPDEKQLADLFLGLSKEVPVSNFETNEIRFGILLPGVRHTNAKLSFQPSPFDTCTIIVRGEDLGSPAVFKGEVFVSPAFLDSNRRLYIKSDLFSIDIHLTETGTQPTFHFDIQGKSCTPTMWGDYWRMLLAFQKNKGIVEIKSNNLQQSTEIAIAVDGMVNLGKSPTPEHAIVVCEGLSKIMRLAGIQPEPPFEFVEIHRVFSQISILLELINGTQPTLTLTETTTTTNLPSKCICASRFQLGNTVIAYYATALFEIHNNNECNPLRLREFTLKKVSDLIDDKPATFERFVETAKAVENIEDAVYF